MAHHPEGIFLSKNFSIIKHLIEECLRRGTRVNKVERDPLDIPMGMALLRVFLAESSRVYVIADNHRLFTDFRDCINLPTNKVTHLWSPEIAIGIEGSIVVLHTGNRSHVQQARFEGLMERLKTSRCVIWHVGDWR